MRKCLHNIMVLAQLDKNLPAKVRVEIRSLPPSALIEDEAIRIHKAVKVRSEGEAELLSCAEEAEVDLDSIAEIINSEAYKLFLGQSAEQQRKAIKDVGNEYARVTTIKNLEKAIEKFSSLGAQDDVALEFNNTMREGLKCLPGAEKTSLADASGECIEHIETVKKAGGELFYPFPFKTLNKYLSGVIPGNIYTFCTFTNGGKTTMGCFLSYFYAVMQAKRILFLTSEVTPNKLNSKFTTVQSYYDKIPSFGISNYMSLEDDKTKQLVEMMSRTVAATGNRIDFQMVDTVDDVLLAIAMATEYDIIILDHFHNLHNIGDVQFAENSCKALITATSKYNKPLFNFAQYNKTLGGKEKEPSANHVKGSSALIQASSVFIHMWAPDEKQGNKEKVYLKIEKNRDLDTPKTYIELAFKKSKQVFEDMGEVEPHEENEDD